MKHVSGRIFIARLAVEDTGLLLEGRATDTVCYATVRAEVSRAAPQASEVAQDHRVSRDRP